MKKNAQKVNNSSAASGATESVLPLSCGRRFIDDNAADPLGHAIAKIVKGDPTKPGAYPWQVLNLFRDL